MPNYDICQACNCYVYNPPPDEDGIACDLITDELFGMSLEERDNTFLNPDYQGLPEDCPFVVEHVVARTQP